MVFRRGRRKQLNDRWQAQNNGEWVTSLFFQPTDDEMETFKQMPFEALAAEIERRTKVAKRLGYIESRPGPKGPEFRVIDDLWWHKCRWVGREHEGWAPYIPANVPDEEEAPPEEVRARIAKAIEMGYIQEMPGNPDWTRVVDPNWWRKTGDTFQADSEASQTA